MPVSVDKIRKKLFKFLPFDYEEAELLQKQGDSLLFIIDITFKIKYDNTKDNNEI